MKLFFTLIILQIAASINNLNAQVDSFRGKATPVLFINSVDPAKAQEVKIVFSCGGVRTRTVSEEPLLVIDGTPVEFSELQKLNPNDIASIDILKENAIDHIGCRPKRGVILVTTKTASTKKFIIKDFLTGEKIPSATICLILNSDTIKAVANEEGIFETDKLKATAQYQVTVSSAGYKSFTTTVKGKEQEILLERDIKENDNVVVIAYHTIRCGCCSNGSCRKITKSETKRADLRASWKIAAPFIYPNPVQRNNTVYLGFENDKEEIVQLSIVGLNGSIVLLQSEKIRKGYNRLSVTANAGWAMGVYVVLLKDQRRGIVKQEKLVVQ